MENIFWRNSDQPELTLAESAELNADIAVSAERENESPEGRLVVELCSSFRDLAVSLEEKGFAGTAELMPSLRSLHAVVQELLVHQLGDRG